MTAHVYSINLDFDEDERIRKLLYPDNYRRTIVEEYHKGKQNFRKHNLERLEFWVGIVLEQWLAWRIDFRAHLDEFTASSQLV